MWITDQITELCVDDFALRKGSTYGTILIDSKSHRVIDLIPSRERKDVAKKLAEYPNLKVVSRDGSPAYAAAISTANPEILQISDRFHLLKGLTEACRYILQGLFKAKIAIQKPEGPAGKPSEYNSSYWEKETKKDAPERTHEKNLARKTEAVGEIRRLSAEGLGISEIVRETGKSYATVKKYLQKEYNPENAGYGRKQPSKLKPYEARIKEMLKRKCTFQEIERAIREEGYDGAASTIRMYATRERRLIKQVSGNREKDIMERRWVVKLLYQPMEKVEGLDKGQLERLLEEYPIVQDIYDLVGSFREILFSKKGEDLEAWLEEADRLGLDEIKSFANGLRRDLEAVKNAASHDYNNGLAEGSVNKLKLVKRKMYGRCSFETLRKKMLLQEYYKISQQT